MRSNRGIRNRELRGAAAGLVGAAAMSAATNAEMRLRGRPPSLAPAKAVAGLLGVSARGELRQKLLGTAGHVLAATSLGVARGTLDRLGAGSRSGSLALFGLAMAPEVVLVPALGAADPPWRWSRADTAISVLHHAVYAAAANRAYEALSPLSEERPPRVLITGGSSGIGLACAREFAAAGSRVALVSRGGAALEEASASIDPPPAIIPADVTDASGLRSAVDEAAMRLGGLDVVVANAGAAAYGPFAEMSPDDTRRTIDTTLTGVVNTAHAALPHLERSEGALVVVGSIAGRVPTPWLAAYTAAKHGVRGFVRSLMAELTALGSPVSVALVAPGPVDSPFWARARTPDGRLPTELRGAYRPEDVATEVVRAARRPGRERTVGGAMAAWAFVDAIAPNLALRIVGPLAKVGWRARGERPASPPDALSHPTRRAEEEGGLRSRPSVLERLRI